LSVPEWVGTEPNHMSRTRSSRVPSASAAFRSPCTHRRTDRHWLASFPTLHAHTWDTL
jgi:hypothetical protein